MSHPAALVAMDPKSIAPYATAYYGHPSPYPPSFEGNPWSYALGLFGDVLAASMALAVLLGFILEYRRINQINVRLDNYVRAPKPIPLTPLWLYRMGMICFLSFVCMRTIPDSLWMLAWGEVSLPVIEFLLRLDMVCDGLAIIPLTAAVTCWAWGRQVIPHKLAEGPVLPAGGRPAVDLLLKNGRIVLVVTFIALAVTIGKASG